MVQNLQQALSSSQAPESRQFLEKYMAERPCQLLVESSELLTGSDVPEAPFLAALTLMSAVLKAGKDNILERQEERYIELSESQRACVKLALFKGLAFPSMPIISYASRCLAEIARLECARSAWKNIIIDMDGFFERVAAGPVPPVGPITLIRDVLVRVEWRTTCINEKKVWTLMERRICPVLAAPMVQNEYTPVMLEAKCVAAEVLGDALKRCTRNRNNPIGNIDKWMNVLGLLISLAKIPHEKLHRMITRALARFFNGSSVMRDERMFAPIVDLTQWAVSSGNANIAKDILRMWKSIGDEENEREKEFFRDEHKFAARMAISMVPMLIQIMQTEDIATKPREWGTGKAAFECMESLARVNPEAIWRQGAPFAQKEVVTPTNDAALMTALLVTQIIGQWLPGDEVSNWVCGMLPHIGNVLKMEKVEFVIAGFVLLLSFLRERPEIWNPQSIEFVLAVVAAGLKHADVDVVEVAVKLMSAVIDVAGVEFMSGAQEKLMGMLYEAIEASGGRSDPCMLLHRYYTGIQNMARKAPSAFHAELILKSLIVQMRFLKDQGESAVLGAKRECISSILGSIMSVYPECVNPVVDEVLQWLCMLLERTPCSDAVATLGLFFTNYPEHAMKCMPCVMGVLQRDFLSGSAPSDLLNQLCLLIGDIFEHRHAMFIDRTDAIFQGLHRHLFEHLSDPNVMTRIIYAISRIVLLNPEELKNPELVVAFARVIGPHRNIIMAILEAGIDNLSLICDIDWSWARLLDAYAGMAKLFDYEAGQGPNGRKLPGEFLTSRIPSYKKVVVVRDKLHHGSWRVRVFAEPFLRYVNYTIDVFDRANNFNLAIHSPCFKKLFHYLLSEDCRDEIRDLGLTSAVTDTYNRWQVV